MKLNVGEVWLVNFPLEENPETYLRRPVIVLGDEEEPEVLSVKVTKTEPREDDEFDTPIVYWKEASLRFKSTARISKTIHLPRSQFIHKIGDLHPEDLTKVQSLFIKYINSLS
jgi:hypothetical protein